MLCTLDVREVPLHGGRFALIDAEDWDRTFYLAHHGTTYAFRICDLSWHCETGGKKHRARHTVYARSSVKRDGYKFSFRMHTLIMGRRDGLVIEHKDADGLHNCRVNLEHITNGENIRRGKQTRRTLAAVA